MDPRIKAAIAIAPWGWNMGFWDRDGLAGISTPTFYMAGSADASAGYSPGVRNIFELATNSERYLLTFENASHNAAAPIPAPKETWPAPGSTVLQRRTLYGSGLGYGAHEQYRPAFRDGFFWENT